MFKSFLATLAMLVVLSTGAFAQEMHSPTSTNSSTHKTNRVRIEYQASMIEQAQQALKAKGLYKGEATGKIDPATKDAIKSFQQQQGLKATGHLNKDTRQKLGVTSLTSEPSTAVSKTSTK